MPYRNMPKSLWPSMERCVASVKAKGKVDNPYSVCYTSIAKNQRVRGVISKGKKK